MTTALKNCLAALFIVVLGAGWTSNSFAACRNGSVCPANAACVEGGGCAFNGPSCPSGWRTTARGTCQAPGTVDCGNGTSCPYPQSCSRDGCVPAFTTGERCGDQRCSPGFSCVRGNLCVDLRAMKACSSGSFCAKTSFCGEGGGCINGTRVNLNASSPQPRPAPRAGAPKLADSCFVLGESKKVPFSKQYNTRVTVAPDCRGANFTVEYLENGKWVPGPNPPGMILTYDPTTRSDVRIRQ
jgi:hypothetical protein